MPFRNAALPAILTLWLATGVAALEQASATDLVFGTWVLDVEASSYRPGPSPKSQTRTYTAHLDGIEAKIETVDAGGKASSIDYVADYDSLEYPLHGSPNVSAIVLKRVNKRTAEATLKHGRRILGEAKRVISEDGNTMTITFSGSGSDGRPIENKAVYHRKTR